MIRLPQSLEFLIGPSIVMTVACVSGCCEQCIHWASSAASYGCAVSYVGLQPVDDGFSAERCGGNNIAYGINKTGG
jgi:hypothetical protein